MPLVKGHVEAAAAAYRDDALVAAAKRLDQAADLDAIARRYLGRHLLVRAGLGERRARDRQVAARVGACGASPEVRAEEEEGCSRRPRACGHTCSR